MINIYEVQPQIFLFHSSYFLVETWRTLRLDRRQFGWRLRCIMLTVANLAWSRDEEQLQRSAELNQHLLTAMMSSPAWRVHSETRHEKTMVWPEGGPLSLQTDWPQSECNGGKIDVKTEQRRVPSVTVRKWRLLINSWKHTTNTDMKQFVIQI